MCVIRSIRSIRMNIRRWDLPEAVPRCAPTWLARSCVRTMFIN
jgi:hypothetical protein